MSKSKEAEAPAKILKYMRDQNRPYSAIDIFTNLHKEFGKTCVQRTLDQLAAEAVLVEKTYGKQKVYVANQSHFPAVDEEALKRMDRETAELQQKLSATEAECKGLESQLATLNGTLTSDEARQQLKEVTEQCSTMEAKVTKLQSGSDSVSPQESERIQVAFKDSVRQWRKRKRMTTDIVNCILEGYPKSKKQFYEEVGIETDEDHGVKVPEL